MAFAAPLAIMGAMKTTMHHLHRRVIASLAGVFWPGALVFAASANVATVENYFTVPHWTVVVATGVLVALAVLVHYEALGWLTSLLRRLQIRRRPRILLLIYSILALHIFEIWLFGIGYYLLLQDPSLGTLVGMPVAGLPDYVYYAAAVYTTLGFGDLTPLGPIRFLTGTEAVTGLVLITWSASFTFLEMQRFWRDK